MSIEHHGALVRSDLKGLIVDWDDGAEAFFGYTREEAVGESLDLIVPEEFRDRHWVGLMLEKPSLASKGYMRRDKGRRNHFDQSCLSIVTPDQLLELTAYQSLRLRVAALPENGVPANGRSSTRRWATPQGYDS